MKRRTILKGAGSASIAVGLAGCLSDLDDDDSDDTDDDPAGSPDDGDDDDVEQPVERAVVDQSIESGTADGDEDDGSSVETDDEFVRINGTLTAPTPCHEAMLDSVDYDGDADELSVVVVAEDTSAPDEACQQVITQLSYEATIEFVGGTPDADSVSVQHRGTAGGTMTDDSGRDY